MVILVTGGAGFIGSTLVKRLVHLGHNVRVLDVLIHGQEPQCPDGARFFGADVRDKYDVQDAAEDCDFIVHLASVAGVSSVGINPVRTMEVGFIGTNNVLGAALANGARVLNISSSEVYGTHVSAPTEDTPTPVPAANHARWGYAAVKLTSEHLAFAYHSHADLDVVTFRIFNTYGPGQLGDGAIHNFIRAALEGKPLTIRGSGEAVRTWCFVEDVIDAMVLAIEDTDEITGHVFNIGNPHTVMSTRGLADAVSRCAKGEPADTRYIRGGDDVAIRIPNIDKAKDLLGWSPKIDLQEGLYRTVKYYRKAMQDA